MKSLIFLIGMPGTGKTTIGKRIAKLLQYPFVDLDESIENNYQTNINTIFKQKGERFFRRIEHITLLRLINHTNASTIISCGGGTPVFFYNLDIMKQNGIIIHLTASIETLFKRLYKSDRPMFENNFNHDEAQNKIIQLLNHRTFYFQQADITYPTDRINTETITNLRRLIFERFNS